MTNKADFVMAFVAHVSDKAHGLLVFNVWHFNKDITEHGMGMGKEVWSKPSRSDPENLAFTKHLITLYFNIKKLMHTIF